jgi:hypothetical protein
LKSETPISMAISLFKMPTCCWCLIRACTVSPICASPKYQGFLRVEHIFLKNQKMGNKKRPPLTSHKGPWDVETPHQRWCPHNTSLVAFERYSPPSYIVTSWIYTRKKIPKFSQFICRKKSKTSPEKKTLVTMLWLQGLSTALKTTDLHKSFSSALGLCQKNRQKCPCKYVGRKELK